MAALLDELKQRSGQRHPRDLDRADLAASGSHPDAAFGLDVVDGFYTGGGYDALVKPSTDKGGHGFEPDRPALHASFIMAGPAVHARQRRGRSG